MNKYNNGCKRENEIKTKGNKTDVSSITLIVYHNLLKKTFNNVKKINKKNRKKKINGKYFSK